MTATLGPPRVDARGLCTGCRTPAADCVCEPVTARREPSPPRLAVTHQELCPRCDRPHDVHGYR